MESRTTTLLEAQDEAEMEATMIAIEESKYNLEKPLFYPFPIPKRS